MKDASQFQVTVGAGRHVDVYTSGPEGGGTFVYHHGTPGSGLAMRAVETVVHGHGLRYVAASRPGYGGSTRHPGRSVVDVVDDTRAVLDALGVSQCLVAGWSGGGPHALACGARLTERVRAVLVIAGVGPYAAEGLDFLEGMGEDNIVEFGKTVEGEAVLRPYLEEKREPLLQTSGADLTLAMGSLLPAVDRAVLTGEIGDGIAACMHEGLRVGVDGWLDDDLACAKPWGFSLDEVSVPTSLWQGSADLMVPFTHGTWLAGQIPNVSVHLEQGEGHLSIVLGKMDLMLEELRSLSAL